jgi:hypothetical protein
MAASTVSTLQSFPAPGSIPPVTFYNMLGLANWLNLNPTYKNNYASTGTFPYLYPQYYSTVFASTTSTFAAAIRACASIKPARRYPHEVDEVYTGIKAAKVYK